MYFDKDFMVLSKVIMFPDLKEKPIVQCSADFIYDDGDPNKFYCIPIKSNVVLPIDKVDVQNFLIGRAINRICFLEDETIYTNWMGVGDFIHNV